MQYSITLVFSKPAGVDEYRSQAFYRLEVVAQDAVNMPTEIFVHRTKQTGDVNRPVIDEFITVAGPLDMAELSSTEPNAKGFFRKDTVNLMLSNMSQYDAVVAKIQSMAQQLCNGLNKLDTVIPDDPVIIVSGF